MVLRKVFTSSLAASSCGGVAVFTQRRPKYSKPRIPTPKRKSPATPTTTPHTPDRTLPQQEEFVEKALKLRKNETFQDYIDSIRILDLGPIKSDDYKSRKIRIDKKDAYEKYIRVLETFRANFTPVRKALDEGELKDMLRKLRSALFTLGTCYINNKFLDPEICSEKTSADKCNKFTISDNPCFIEGMCEQKPCMYSLRTKKCHRKPTYDANDYFAYPFPSFVKPQFKFNSKEDLENYKKFQKFIDGDSKYSGDIYAYRCKTKKGGKFKWAASKCVEKGSDPNESYERCKYNKGLLQSLMRLRYNRDKKFDFGDFD